MVEVVFHIGAHKCATTSIQRGLGVHAARLPGLVYVPPVRPQSKDDATEPTPALKSLIRLVGRDEPPRPTRDAVVEALCRLIEANASKNRVVVSDEYMLGGMPGLVWRFYPRVEELRAVLGEVARRFKTSVLLQSREPVSYLRSCWQFRVRFGMTTGYDGFLERFDLASVSWARLGKTLFDGARFDWRVLPFETLADPARANETAAALRFVLPDWDFAAAPLGTANPSNGPLMRAATFVLRRAGIDLPTAPRGRPSLLLAEAEAAVAAAEPGKATQMIRATLAKVRVEIDMRTARAILAQFEEERAPQGALQELLRDRFAPDYAAFLAAFAPGGVAAGARA